MKLLILFFAVFVIRFALCMEQKEFMHNVAIGSVTGVAEVMVNQPLMCIKNMLQQGKIISLRPRILYRGFGINATCIAPTTALLIATDKALEAIAPGADIKTSAARAFGAGFISTLASSPTELVILIQQNEGKSAYKTIKNLIDQKGIRVISRGMVSKSLREGGFGVGFLSMYPWLKNSIHHNLIDNEAIALPLAGVIAGAGTVVATHPFDTISTCMQADYKSEQVKTMRQATQRIYEQYGMRGFYKGVVPRGTRVAVAIPLMDEIQRYLSKTTAI
jgi:Mitochondrial carrier protein.